MSRRLALVSLDWTRAKDPPLSLGHASILASLKSTLPHLGSRVLSFERSVINPDFDPKAFAHEILAEDDGMTDVAIGCFVWNEADVQIICEALDTSRFSGKILLGGPQISYCPASELEGLYPRASAFIRGYAEDAMCSWLGSGGEARGIHRAGEFDWNFQAQPELESLSSPLLLGVVPLQRFMRWETQRGCPFMCSFCQHRDQSDPETRQQRKRATFCNSRIYAEAEHLCKDSIVQDLAILDPVFNSGKSYMFVLDALNTFGYSGKLSLQCRFEMVTKEFLDAVSALEKRHGAKVTLEFGIQTIQKKEWELIRRANNMRRVEKALGWLFERNLHFEISLIYGLPNQTFDSFVESVNWCLERGVPVIKAWPLMLLRGTALHQERAKHGFVEEMDSVELSGLQTSGLSFGRAMRVMQSIPHVVESNSFSRLDWAKMGNVASILQETEGAHPSRLAHE